MVVGQLFKKRIKESPPMMLIRLFLAAFLCLPLYATSSTPLLVVLLMVKDEKHVLEPTLSTYVTQTIKSGDVDSGEVAYVLHDTGSTDGTQDAARELFTSYGIKNWQIFQTGW